MLTARKCHQFGKGYHRDFKEIPGFVYLEAWKAGNNFFHQNEITNKNK